MAVTVDVGQAAEPTVVFGERLVGGENLYFVDYFVLGSLTGSFFHGVCRRAVVCPVAFCRFAGFCRRFEPAPICRYSVVDGLSQIVAAFVAGQKAFRLGIAGSQARQALRASMCAREPRTGPA